MEYRNKDANHVEWAKALKELYVPGLRDYVKSHYPLGPVWSATGKIAATAPTKAPAAKAPAPGAPAPPPPPPASLFSSETEKPTSSAPKVGMSAVFEEISSGKPVTSGNYHFSDISHICIFIEFFFFIFMYVILYLRSQKGHS